MSILLNYAFEILAILWIVAITRSILFWLNFIQIKQYRADRIWFELKRKSFYKLVFSSYRIILIVLLIAWEIVLRSPLAEVSRIFDGLFFVIILYFLLNALLLTKGLIKRSLQLPKFTKKVWLLFGAAMVIELFIAYQYTFWPEQLIAIEIIQPFIVILLFYLAYSPNLVLHKRLKQKAREKRSAHKDLIVIGITGSFGKTTMKEYLTHILSKKFKVLKTPEHVNVDTGIAKLVLNKLVPEHEVFIVEMGAYKVGEIKSICDIVAPTHAIMTGLGNQHLELFGSQENITKAKFELVDAVKDFQNVFANQASKLLEAEFQNKGLEPNWYDEDILLNNLFSKANKISLAGAIMVARDLGVSMHEIEAAITSLPKIHATMEEKTGPNDSLLVDDSYNANTDGVLAALGDLKDANFDKKIFVFKEIIELGKEAQKDHALIADKILESANMVMLLPSPYRDQIEKHLLAHEVDKEKILSPENIEQLKAFLDKNTIVLFEGRGTERILGQLLT